MVFWKKNKKKLADLSEPEIIDEVAQKYSEVASKPGDKFNFPVGRKFAVSVGYPQDILDSLASEFSDSFTGAGNPQPHARPEPGESILDLGCGAGLDLYFYACAVGGSGQVYGIDISKAMLDKAGQNLAGAGISGVKFLLGASHDIPCEDNSLDAVYSNGIYNLSPDKKKVMAEVYRVLKPGGRTVFSEIVLKEPLEAKVRKNIDDWFRCIGGALTEETFIESMKDAGFRKVDILAKGRNARTGHKSALCANIRAIK